MLCLHLNLVPWRPGSQPPRCTAAPVQTASKFRTIQNGQCNGVLCINIVFKRFLLCRNCCRKLFSHWDVLRTSNYRSDFLMSKHLEARNLQVECR